MKILITGAAGFLGIYLSEKYVNEGHIVYGIDNLVNGNLNNVRTLLHRKNFKFIHDDIRSKDLFKTTYRLGCNFSFGSSNSCRPFNRKSTRDL